MKNYFNSEVSVSGLKDSCIFMPNFYFIFKNESRFSIKVTFFQHFVNFLTLTQ